MMYLSEAAKVIKGQLVGADVKFTCVGTDSRNVQQGELFIAIKGERFDGQTFVQQAIEFGAVAVLVTKALTETNSGQPQSALIVEDTTKALGELAAYWRSKFDLPLAAITGSNGKTTVKEMLTSILRIKVNKSDEVLATEGNLNNHIGVPLTLLKLRKQHQYAVIEMGMNHQGEIAYLTKIGQPNVAVINNVGHAHVGELGSFEAIASAKGEILEGLVKQGIAIINADDVFASFWEKLAVKHKIITFGLKNKADISATYALKDNSSLVHINTPEGQVDTEIPVPGIHNVMNALAACAAATSMGVSLSIVAKGLEAYSGVRGRLQHLYGVNGALVIDDSYNANPSSMMAAIDVLVAKPGKKLLVLGDMGELGEESATLHAEIGKYAKKMGVEALFTIGEMSKFISIAFGTEAKHFETRQTLIADLIANMQPTSVVLVKGSRFMAMENIVNEITHKKGLEN